MLVQITWHLLGFPVGRWTSSGGFFLAAVLHHPKCPLQDVVQESFISFKSFSGAVEIRDWCWVLTDQAINKTWTEALHAKWNPQHNWTLSSCNPFSSIHMCHPPAPWELDPSAWWWCSSSWQCREAGVGWGDSQRWHFLWTPTSIQWHILVISLKLRSQQGVIGVPEHTHLMPFCVSEDIWAPFAALSGVTQGLWESGHPSGSATEVRQPNVGCSGGAKLACSGTWVIPRRSEDVPFICHIVRAACSVTEIDTEDT